jgi:hypothetical protein
MKKTRQRKVVKKKSNESTQFAIEMDVKGMILFLTLVILTSGTIFYLGVIFGKATRDPNVSPSPSEYKVKVLTPKKRTSEKKLDFYNVRDESDGMRNLRKNTKLALGKADRMIKESESRKQRAAASKKNGQGEKKKDARTAQKRDREWPDNRNVVKPSGELYTIQILATKDKGKAMKIVEQLRKKAFDSYLINVTVGSTIIYRVRVGKRSKEGIETLKEKLDRVVGGMGIKPKILKIE